MLPKSHNNYGYYWVRRQKKPNNFIRRRMKQTWIILHSSRIHNRAVIYTHTHCAATTNRRCEYKALVLAKYCRIHASFWCGFVCAQWKEFDCRLCVDVVWVTIFDVPKKITETICFLLAVSVLCSCAPIAWSYSHTLRALTCFNSCSLHARKWLFIKIYAHKKCDTIANATQKIHVFVGFSYYISRGQLGIVTIYIFFVFFFS